MLIILLTVLLLQEPKQVEKPRIPKRFTAEWYDHQCRVLGAICPQKPICQLDPHIDERPSANRTCGLQPLAPQAQQVARKQ